jgi:hypothetical protein
VLFAIIIPVAAFGTPAAQQGGNFNVSVAGSDSDSVHQIDLKVIQLPGGQLSEVSGFVISPENVVQIKQGENLIVSTSADLKVHQVKVTNTQGQLVDLLSLQNNVWSLQGLTPGVYLLDVIVDISSSGIMGAYETVLVILQPDQQPLPPAQYINQITTKVRTDVRIIFQNDTRTPTPIPPKPPSPCYFDPTLPECQPVDGKCSPGFGFNDNDQCIPIGICPDGYGRLDDDETGKCYKNSDIKTCPDGYITHKNEECPKPSPTPTPTPTPTDYCVPYLMSPEQYAAECASGPGLVPGPAPPICTDETPADQVCRDEGDLPSDPGEVTPPEDNEGPPSTGDDDGGGDDETGDDEGEEGGGSDDNNGGEENVPQFGN